MTHDELLAVVQNSYSGIPDFKGNWKANQALRAVVELHKPRGWVCAECNKDSKDRHVKQLVAYPCPTIQKIEKRLE